MRKFIRENLVLIMGISLPLLLVLLFFLTSVLPKSLGTPPQYDLLFSVVRYDYQTATTPHFDFIVQDGVLKVRTGKTDNQNPTRYTRKLLVFNADNEAVREIPYDLVQISNMEEQSEIVLPETQQMTIDPSSRSPDGYSFEGPSHGGGGLMSELFFGGYRNQGYRIVKGKSAYNIPNNFNSAYVGELQFIGWILKRQE
ncbi:MAG TPA: hypothetical protein VFF75_04910 [Methylophilaceae bacterium]|nr:hypothetical protein [Methylophilaceae bacterium]